MSNQGPFKRYVPGTPPPAFERVLVLLNSELQRDPKTFSDMIHHLFPLNNTDKTSALMLATAGIGSCVSTLSFLNTVVSWACADDCPNGRIAAVYDEKNMNTILYFEWVEEKEVTHG